MVKLLDPTLDVVFKLLFAHERNRNLLISLLTAVLAPSTPIVEVEVLNPEVDKETIRDKGIVLDVRVRLQDGRLFNVEMQSQRHPGLRSRALLYWARIYAQQMHRGDHYESLTPTVSLFILDFNELHTAHYHSEFRLLEVKEHFPFSEDLVLHILELPKVPGIQGKKPTPAPKGEPLLAKWGRFFKVKNSKQLKELAMNDPIFQEAKTALETLSSDPKAQALAEERRIGAYFYERSLRLAEEEGETRGRAAGERLVLEKLLTLKFGPLSDEMRERLSKADESRLTLWAERILTARSVDEVFEV